MRFRRPHTASRLSIPRREQFPRVSAAYLAVCITAKHASDLRDPLLSFNLASISGGDARARTFSNYNVVVRSRRDLRQV